MHWPSPAQRPRIAEIRDNLIARIAEAEREGWHGEAEGLKTQPIRRSAQVQKFRNLAIGARSALAATHPAARSHPIEVRPFENE